MLSRSKMASPRLSRKDGVVVRFDAGKPAGVLPHESDQGSGEVPLRVDAAAALDGLHPRDARIDDALAARQVQGPCEQRAVPSAPHGAQDLIARNAEDGGEPIGGVQGDGTVFPHATVDVEVIGVHGKRERIQVAIKDGAALGVDRAEALVLRRLRNVDVVLDELEVHQGGWR